MSQPSLQMDHAERERLLHLSIFEEEARRSGFSTIAGIDEAGRGPLAGPVVAAACILPAGYLVPGVNDSKMLTPQKREYLYEQMVNDPNITFAVSIVHAEVIDSINIYQATIEAMLEAVSKLALKPDLLLVDGMHLERASMPSKKINKGDSRSISIASASIFAKVTRDHLMEEYHGMFPEYGFDQHKGYGTAKHREAIAKYGPCPIHRMTFSPFTLEPVL